MLSITAAAQRLNLPRDVVLDAVRVSHFRAAPDRRGIRRIAAEDLEVYQAVQAARSQGPAFHPGPLKSRYRVEGGVIWLSVISADRVATVVAQRRRLKERLSAQNSP
jgi:hypothetical protein